MAAQVMARLAAAGFPAEGDAEARVPELSVEEARWTHGHTGMLLEATKLGDVCRELREAYECSEFLSDPDVTKLAWPTVVREKMHKHVASKR